MLQKPETGTILLATHLLKGSYFEETIVFLVDYNEKEGCYGLVLNHASHMPLNEVFGGLASDGTNYQFQIGGPVQENMLQIIQTEFSALNDSVELFPGVFIGGEWHNDSVFLDKVLQHPNLRIFLGYTGWGQGQLEEEIQEGAWEVIKTEPFELLHSTRTSLQIPASEFRSHFSLK